MGRIKTRLPKLSTLILLWIGGIILLGLVGWGIGWTAQRLFTSKETPMSTETVKPLVTFPPATATPMETIDGGVITPVIVATQAVSPTVSAEGTDVPSAVSTDVPRPTLIEEENEVVQSGDGLFQVCRRHCPERWPPDDDALPAYAQAVAELNGLVWPDPALSPGQILKMPPCPE
jgi:hypothetical protein